MLSMIQNASWVKWGKTKTQTGGNFNLLLLIRGNRLTVFDNNGMNASKVITKSHLNSFTLVNVHLKLLSPEALFSPKCTKYRLAAGLPPDPLGELTALPQTH